MGTVLEAMSNWEKLKSKLDEDKSKKGKKRKRSEISQAVERDRADKAKEEEKAMKLRRVEEDDQGLSLEDKERYIGMDCEMVGVGLGGKRSALARVTLVDFDGEVIYDQHVRPNEKITDFRTWVSGVKAKHLKDALPLKEVMMKVGEMLKGKVLVGHALHNDLQALMLQHPVKMIRDTARFAAYMRPKGPHGGKLRPRSLKDLTKQHLGLDIQGGKHDSGEDARCAMLLYRAKRTEWERELKGKKLKVT